MSRTSAACWGTRVARFVNGAYSGLVTGWCAGFRGFRRVEEGPLFVEELLARCLGGLFGCVLRRGPRGGLE